MAHFAKINENNMVTQVIVVHNNELLDENGQESEAKGIAFCQSLLGGNWKQTSYNGKIRGTYAGVGYSYLPDKDIFVAPQPYPSWTRNGSFWDPPVPKPQDKINYTWDEETLSWKEVE